MTDNVNNPTPERRSYRLPSQRAMEALAEHLSRLPEPERLSIEGFRIPVGELFGMICHACAAGRYHDALGVIAGGDGDAQTIARQELGYE